MCFSLKFRACWEPQQWVQSDVGGAAAALLQGRRYNRRLLGIAALARGGGPVFSKVFPAATTALPQQADGGRGIPPGLLFPSGLQSGFGIFCTGS